MRWSAEESSQPVHDVTERRGVLVPMRDGTRLSLDIFLPAVDGPAPTILTITPYDNNNERAILQFIIDEVVTCTLVCNIVMG